MTIVNVEDTKKYFGSAKLYANDTNLFSYCDSRLNVVGYFLVSVQIFPHAVSPPLKLCVVKSEKDHYSAGNGYER